MAALSSIQLEAFLCLAQTNHFTRAAERLHVTQSALSQRISNLETELEATLFIRERSGVRLTHTGLELLRYCQVKESLESEFISKLRSNLPHKLAGQLRIAGYSTVTHSVLLPALSSLLQRHEEITLSCMTRELGELPGLLQSGEVDFIVLDHKWEREGIASILLGEEEHVLIEKKNYKGLEVFLDHDENDQTTERYFKLQKKKWKGKRHFLDDINGIIEGVRLGIGRAVVSRHLISEETNEFKINKLTHPNKNPVVLHYYEHPFYSKLHQSTVRTLIENCERYLR